MCLFLVELNAMEAYATDIGDAHFEAKTHEIVKNFGALQGHMWIIYKTFYGMQPS